MTPQRLHPPMAADRPYVVRPYSGIGRLRLALTRGAYIAEVLTAKGRETKELVGAGYQPRKRTIALAVRLGDVVPAEDGLLPDCPQTWRAADHLRSAA